MIMTSLLELSVVWF